MKINKGFTLVELMVVVSIFLIITAVIFFDAPRFRDTSGVDLMAQDLASSIKLAQTYGVGSLINPGEQPAYGIRFESDSDNFLIFKSSPDEDENNLFYVPGVFEQQYRLSGGIISDLCHFNSNDGKVCGLSEVQVSFKRPYSEAYFCVNNNCTQNDYSSVIIILKANRLDVVREIVVHKNGQIEVRQND